MQHLLRLAATDGEHVRFVKALGTRRLIGSGTTNGAFGLVEHDLPERQLGSPIHTHEREDEYSFVLEGILTAQVGDAVVTAAAGELVLKPRGTPHAFWNSGPGPVRFLEMITPGGFEEYFFEMAGPFNARDLAAIGAIRDRYHLRVDLESIPGLLARNDLLPPV